MEETISQETAKANLIPTEHDAQHQEATATEEPVAEDHTDYSEYSKDDLITRAGETVHHPDTRLATEIFRRMRLAFDQLQQNERQEMIAEWTAAGNDPREFKAPSDPLRARFNAIEQQFRERKADEKRRAEEEKLANYKRKKEILDRISTLVDAEETQESLKQLKDLQNEWKKIRSIPNEFKDELFERYKFYLDKFYDNLSKFNELKQLDREKNLSAKIELCLQADKLLQEDNVRHGFNQLAIVQEEWRNIGPVPREASEELWKRFKETCDKVVARYKEKMAEQQSLRDENLKQKVLLCEKLEELNALWPSTPKEWKKRSEEVEALMEDWKKIGQVPKEDNDSTWERFKNGRKDFFQAKKNYFGKLDSDRDTNLKAKQDLCAAAEKLSERSDWGKTTEELLLLQEQWKKIGPVPEKESEAVWKRFREAFDRFFDRKNAALKVRKQEEKENLRIKQEVVAQMEALDAQGDGEEVYKQLRELQTRWMQTGFVPSSAKESLQKRYQEVADKLFGRFRQNREQMKESMLREHLETMLSGPDASNRLRTEERRLRERINGLRNDASTIENNMAFFANSKGTNADQIRKQFDEKRTALEQQIQRLEKELKMLRSMKPGNA